MSAFVVSLKYEYMMFMWILRKKKKNARFHPLHGYFVAIVRKLTLKCAPECTTVSTFGDNNRVVLAIFRETSSECKPKSTVSVNC